LQKLLFCSAMKQFFLLCIPLFLFGSLHAQPLKSMSSSELLWELQNLSNTGSALYFAAHPDDENTRLISYLANERHIRTAYLSLTRGDGGQNLIGSEKGPLLGMVRTQELLAARRTDHGTQYFSRAYDFGYSKNPEETFHFWNKDSVLADAVWVIRTFKPDVIICRFPTTGEGGHGHHTGSAMIAEEAFTAAADPTKFAYQLKYTSTWQAKRIVWNTFNFGGTNTTSPDQLKLDVGGFNPLLGKYNGEIAAESRSMHKSQGFGSEKSRGSQLEYFKPIKGEKAVNDLFDGVDLSWNRYKETKELKKRIDQLISDYPYKPQDALLKDLMIVYKAFQKIPETDKELAAQKELKIAQLKKIILGYCGIWADATTSVQTVSPGESLKINYTMINSGKVPVSVIKISTGKNDSKMDTVLTGNELKTFSQTIVIAENAGYSTPYWLKLFPEKGLFQVSDLFWNTRAENDPEVVSSMTFKIGDDTFSVTIPVRYKTVDPVKGEIYQPLYFVPQVTINLPYSNYLFTDGKTRMIPVTLTSNVDSISGKITIAAPRGWKVKLQQESFTLKGKGSQTVIQVEVAPEANAQNEELSLVVKAAGRLFNLSLTSIHYDHIPYQNLLQPATVHLVYEPMHVPKLKIGYIPGAGDEVADLLKQMNLDVVVLSDEQLASSSLQQFDAIVTGVRAYNTNEKLQSVYAKMMTYVEQGGNLIVQYNTNSRVGPLKTQMGPYPFTITRDRVTDENAAVTLLDPRHSLFNTPNVISPKDFEGWIQERGIYFASEWDTHYQPLLRMNDPGEKANDGALIVAPYGKGNFVYTGLVFFRELPAGVRGAYKLFLNMLALPKHK
jgi:LmbE family N-acetylglucosaminyl deacetylase